MLKDRKGLFSDASSTVIAVIVILIFIYGVVKIYGAFTNQDSLVAKAVLDKIDATVSILKSGEGTSLTLQGPATWVLVGWSKDDSERPDKCFFKSCYCACPNLKTGSALDKQILKDYCQNNGLCRLTDQAQIDFPVNKNLMSQYYTKTNAGAMGFNDFPVPADFVISTKNDFEIIPFSPNLIQLQINKTKIGLSIYQTG